MDKGNVLQGFFVGCYATLDDGPLTVDGTFLLIVLILDLVDTMLSLNNGESLQSILGSLTVTIE